VPGGVDVNQRKRLRKRLLIGFNPDFEMIEEGAEDLSGGHETMVA
jgi:hypothetical protein